MVEKLTTTERIAKISDGLEVWRIGLDDVMEQDKNARTMAPETYERLVANIQERGELESLPLCHISTENEKPYIISGHHRIRAARSAGLKAIPVLMDTSGLTHSQVVAKQLSHNSIQGIDDRQILAELYQEMKTVEDMLASHIDPKALELADDFKSISIEDIRVDFTGRTVVFAFLPSEIDRFKELADQVPKDTELVGTSTEEFHKTFIQTLNRVGVECEIRNVGAMISKMTDLVSEYLGEPVEDDSAVPLGSLFGTTTVSKETAEIIEQGIISQLGDKVEDKNKWMALERWAYDASKE